MNSTPAIRLSRRDGMMMQSNNAMVSDNYLATLRAPDVARHRER
jgi:hypothetical protein